MIKDQGIIIYMVHTVQSSTALADQRLVAICCDMNKVVVNSLGILRIQRAASPALRRATWPPPSGAHS